MDDFILLGPDKSELNNVRETIALFAKEHLKLSLNKKTSVFSEARGVDFLGFRIWRTHRLLRKRSIKSMKRKLKKFEELYENGEIGTERIRASIMAWIGHAKHADTYNLRKKVLGEFVLRRGMI